MSSVSEREAMASHRHWSAEGRLSAVVSTWTMCDADLAASLRRTGLRAETLQEWRDAAIQALTDPPDSDERSEGVAAFQERVPRLTFREYQVIALAASGCSNKQVSIELGIALDTVKVHRGRATAKLGVRSIARLARLWERAGLDAAPPARRPARRPGPRSTDGAPLEV
jgi:DNA-binding CsgD family transcriptional regulator